MATFSINGLEAVVFLGASPTIAALIDAVRAEGLQAAVITSPAQVAEIPPDCAPKVFETTGEDFENYVKSTFTPKRTLFVSLGARWVFKSRTINDLMCGNLVNCHGARLPFDGGGGGFSWRIMARDRIDTVLIHLVDEGLDSGPVVAHSSAIIPRGLVTPKEIDNHYRERFVVFFADFLSKLRRGHEFDISPQMPYIGRYFPRLRTDVNGWIDWSWSSDAIESFVAAFDEPYAGASTMLNGSRVRLKGVQRHGGEPSGHPFFSGLVVRHDGDWIVVSTNDAFSLLVESVVDANGTNILSRVRPGDRFATPVADLDTAKSERTRFTATTAS